MSAVSLSKPGKAVPVTDFSQKGGCREKIEQCIKTAFAFLDGALEVASRGLLKRKSPSLDTDNGSTAATAVVTTASRQTPFSWPKRPKISATGKSPALPVSVPTAPAATTAAVADDKNLSKLALEIHKACSFLSKLDEASFEFSSAIKIPGSFNPFASEEHNPPFIKSVFDWASQTLVGGTFSRNQVCEMFVSHIQKMETSKHENLYELMLILLAMFEYPLFSCAERQELRVAVTRPRSSKVSVPARELTDYLTGALSVYLEFTERLFSCGKINELKFKFPDQETIISRAKRFISYDAVEGKPFSGFVRDWASRTLAGGTFTRNQICTLFVERIRTHAKRSTYPRADYERTLILLAMFELPLLRCADPLSPAPTTAAAASK